MSADDGYLLRQRDNGKYVLHHYFASDDEYPDKETDGEEFDTIEEAVTRYNDIETNDYPSEYGLRVIMQQGTPPPTS